MPVELRSITKRETNFHAPNASAAYAERFSPIGIPAVAAAAAQVRRAPLDTALKAAGLRKDVPATLLDRDDA